MIGIRLGVDVGKARVGVARSDALGALAFPLETVPRELCAARDSGAFAQLWQDVATEPVTADIARLLELVAEHSATEVIVGLPLNLQGEYTPSTADAEFFARVLATALAAAGSTATVRLVDERLSTKTAQQQLHAAGKKTKQSRAVIDQAAAVIILQQTLDADSLGAVRVGTVAEIFETKEP
ncbi:Holliday junction resolvase RuvX [Leucobacter sp. OH2974_COT-288]|nr:Holliday junction resolvase RuvX [Leucobacter sp. OH2974_COT-288]